LTRPITVMARLDRAIALTIVLMPMTRSGRAMTRKAHVIGQQFCQLVLHGTRGIGGRVHQRQSDIQWNRTF
jgi:hypothetical protein